MLNNPEALSKFMPKKMLPFWLYSVKTLPGYIKILFIISFLYVIIFEIFSKCPNIGKQIILIIISKISYSLISATIFYYLVQHFPREKRKLKSFYYLNSKINNLVQIVEETYVSCGLYRQKDRRRAFFLEKCKAINPELKPHPNFPFNSMNECFEINIKKMGKEIDSIFTNYDILTSELQDCINQIYENLYILKAFESGYKYKLYLDGGLYPNALFNLLHFTLKAEEIHYKNYKHYYFEIIRKFSDPNEASRGLQGDVSKTMKDN